MTQSDLASRLNALFALWEGQAPAAIVKDLLSFAPTRHVISTASGIRFFTCCAVDTLLIAHLLDEDVDIETTPPGHAEPLRINVHDKELRVSRSAVIAIPVQHDDHQIRETFCPYANGFPDEDAYQQWAATAPVPTICGPIKDAFDITSVIADRLKNLAARVGQRASCCSS
jgi:alkylmercury lyase